MKAKCLFCTFVSKSARLFFFHSCILSFFTKKKTSTENVLSCSDPNSSRPQLGHEAACVFSLPEMTECDLPAVDGVLKKLFNCEE